MKKLIIVLMMVIISFNLFSLDSGLITGFEIEYNIIKGISLDSYIDNQSDSISISLKTGYRIENIRIIGTYTNTLNVVSLDSYNPIQDRFKIDISYKYKNMTIGLYHWCDHPVITNSDDRNIFSNSAQRAIYVSLYKEY